MSIPRHYGNQAKRSLTLTQSHFQRRILINSHWYDIGGILTGAACGAENAYPSEAPNFTFGFHRGSCCLVICVSLFHCLVFWILSFDCSFCLSAPEAFPAPHATLVMMSLYRIKEWNVLMITAAWPTDVISHGGQWQGGCQMMVTTKKSLCVDFSLVSMWLRSFLANRTDRCS